MPESFIPITKPVIGEPEAAAARRPILSGWVTQGPEVAAFEREFADAVGAPHACAVSSCTTALHLALVTAGVQPGDEVITASHSFIATANSIRYCGAIPVFADIEPQSLNLDPESVEAAITPRTRAILCVHQIGMPCDLSRLLPMARGAGIPLIEDAACAIGSEINWGGRWERLGKPHADAACFSFHPRKLVTTGDGGMITTANPEWDNRYRLLRQHAMNVPDTVRHGSRDVIYESYTSVGFNYRMTDIQAAVGREQLKRLPEIVERRRQLASGYTEILSAIGGFATPFEPAWARTNWQSYAITLPPGCDQRQVAQFMLDRGIATRRGIMCAHLEPAYQKEPWLCGPGARSSRCAPGECTHLKRSEAAQNQRLLLPMFHDMTAAQQRQVASALGEALAAGADEGGR
jgi:perosamine synthetase